MAYTWGSTPAERARPFPCDRWVEHADTPLFRAIDVDAPAAVVFRWLCQLRVAPYSYDWIDNFGRQSPRQLLPGLDALAVGQTVMTFFELVDFERDHHVTARMRTPFGALAGSYVVVPVSPSACRLIVKLAVRYPRGPLGWTARWLLPWGDLIMMRKQLLTLKSLAEGHRPGRVKRQAFRTPGRARAMRKPRAISATTSCTVASGSFASRIGRPSTR